MIARVSSNQRGQSLSVKLNPLSKPPDLGVLISFLKDRDGSIVD